MPEPLSPGPELYRELIEEVPAVAYVAVPDDVPRVLYASPQSRQVLGREPEAWADPDVITSSLHPDDRERVLTEWARAAEAGEPFSLEYRYLHPDGSTRWLAHRARPEVDESGGVRFVVGFVMDITVGRRAEISLEESEARYRALVENIPAVIYEMGPDDERRTTYVSPHVESVLGYTRAEWLDQPDIWMELLHPDDRETELAANDLHNQTGEPWLRHYRLTAADGRTVWVRDQAVLVRPGDEGRATWQGVMLDITAQKEAEENLRHARDELEFRVRARTAALADANELMALEIEERRRAQDEADQAERRFSVLVEHLPAVVYTWELAEEGEPEYTSPQIEGLLGYQPGEWNDTALWVDRLHPHDRERVLSAAERCRQTGEPLNIECRYLDREGKVVWVLDRATLVRRDDAARPATFQGVMLPITARKTAEAKAGAAEAKYRLLAEGGPVIAYIWHRRAEGPQSPFSYMSPQVEDLLGYPLERWNADVGFWRSILHPDDRVGASAMDLEAQTSGEPWSMDYRVIAADGRVVWLHDEGQMLERDEQGAPSVFQGTFLDITDRKDEEARLRSSEERLRAVVEGVPAIPWAASADPATGRSRLTYVGPQVMSILGHSPDDLMSDASPLAGLLPFDGGSIEASVGEPWEVRQQVRTRDGRLLWLRSIAHVSTDRGGNLVWNGIALLDRVDDAAAPEVVPTTADPAV